MENPSLAGLTPGELEEILSPLPRFRVMQIYNWIIRGACGFDQMTDIPKSLRNDLKTRFSFFSGSIVICNDDRADSKKSDAKKIALSLKDSLKTESVLLNDGKTRFTACLSVQAGCQAGCVFCKTGSLGFKRNLTSSEIVEQFLHLQIMRLETTERKTDDSHIIENIVFMGMGEPLLNLENLRKAVNVFTDPKGLNISRRRITLSTCGICAGLADIAEKGPFVRLALSLTTADENLRRKLMPISKTNPLEKIKEAIIRFQQNGGGRVTLEIPLLGRINTRERDAFLTAEFAKGMDCVINIIPWNPIPGLDFENKPLIEPEKKEIEEFIKMLEGNGLKTVKRLGKGRSVMGACGQLGA
jgi:23S rRNA (adenine2503-C2)-methyltransferase